MPRHPFCVSLLLSLTLACLAAPQTSATAGSPHATVSPQTIDQTLEFLAQDELRGRFSPNSPGNRQARRWLKRWLESRDLVPAGSAGGFEQPFEHGANLLAVYVPPGYEEAVPRGDNPPVPSVVIGAHYDHVEECRARKEAASPVCNGAADNAAGVAVALSALESVMKRAEEPVALALWDAEEAGLLGSAHFAENPTFDFRQVKLYINLDIIGLNLFRNMGSVHLGVGAETGGEPLVSDLEEAAEPTSLDLKQFSYALGQGRSDMTSFISRGYEVPFVFFTDADGAAYHTTADELQHLNRGKVKAVAEAVANLTVSATERSRSYGWKAPREVLGTYAPRYEDVAPLLSIVESVLASAKDNDLAPAQRDVLRESAEDLRKYQSQGRWLFNLNPLRAKAFGKKAKKVLGIARQLDFIP